MPSSKSPNKTPIKPQGVCGRADLAAALADGDAALAHAVAELVGFDQRPPAPDRQPEDETGLVQIKPVSLPTSVEEKADQPLAPTLFWRPVAYAPLAEDEPAPPSPSARYQGWQDRPTDPPPAPPLAAWRELEPKLRRLLCLPQQSRAVDLELTVRRLSQGRFLTDLPRERRRRWGPTIYLIEDRSSRLIPYRWDQYLVRVALQRLLPAHALERSIVRDGMRVPRRLEGGAWNATPPPESIVLVLGDLGCLASVRADLVEYWLRFGRDLRAGGCTPVALIPAPLERCPLRLACVWQLVPWERPRPQDPTDTLATRAERLLRLVSPAVRLEPGLLRAARLLLPPDQADAGTEADVWQHPDLVSRSAAGATLNPERAKPLRAEFVARVESEFQARFAELLRAWRGYLPEEIWFEELLNLPSTAQADPKVAQDLPNARAYFAEFAQSGGDGGEGMTGNDVAWFSRVKRRADLLWTDGQVGSDLLSLSYALHPNDPRYQFPPVKPVLIRRPDKPVSRLAVSQRGGMLEFAVAEAHPDGSHLADLTTRNHLIQIEVADDPNAFWRSNQPPAWADDWGTDDYGHWVTFSIKDEQSNKVTQRLRWIEPGTFLMGSPPDESGRWDDEGPQHPVTISQGFWLFDTACTQALWQAVMGNNPSEFKGDDRPVEQVNWNDCQHFLQKLNERLPGLALSLPTEAQWEYACRAGTTTPFSFGPNITREQVNYGSNQTVPVASLPPNQWGLYEMHGNVWEWCQDHWHNNYQGAPTDGSPWEDRSAGADRVIRGGSWLHYARRVRAAYRARYGPDRRLDGLGFRCARVQVSQASQAGQPGAEPAEPALGRLAERRPTQVPPGGAPRAEPVLLRLDLAPSPARCALPQAPAFFIHTDRERLTFRSLTKPQWASAIGRDRFGLWSEIAIELNQGEPVIQRLRWIPPGGFWMGSPESETSELAKNDNERDWFKWEHPQHPVILTQGYWLFDTPCTQALWEAVMGDNPSNFKSPTRPVEQVSWDQVQDFLKQINTRFPDLNLTLPSEAQWEYACRAGTETAIYTGELAILGENNAPALDPIAWYGGNSGVEFDLPNGYDSSDWKEKQYPHTRAGTRPVKLKQANPWGLYDMLGNVWEWCQDGLRDYTEDAVTNPVGPLAGASRVICGGSWGSDARHVRAAYRPLLAPIPRRGNLGFRCARVQGREQSRSASPASSSQPVSPASPSQPADHAAPDNYPTALPGH